MKRAKKEQCSFTREATVISLIVVLLCSGNAVHASERSADLMAVLDLSGSMTEDDGAGRYSEFFVWLSRFAKQGDRIGVTVMGDGARLIVPLEDAGGFSEESLSSALKRRERYTDLAAGLETAYYHLKSNDSPAVDRFILLFSDAKIDLRGGEWDERNAYRYILERLIPSLKEDNVHVIGVVPSGLTADFQLLHELTVDTGGSYHRGLPDDVIALRNSTESKTKTKSQPLSHAPATVENNESTTAFNESTAASKAVPPFADLKAPSVTVLPAPAREHSISAWLIAVLVSFGLLLTGILGFMVYLFKTRVNPSAPDAELAQMLDDVHALRELSVGRRSSAPEMKPPEAASNTTSMDEPSFEERFSIKTVSPFLEFEEKQSAMKGVPSDDISAKPAFSHDDKDVNEPATALSTMETMLGILPPDLEKHD